MLRRALHRLDARRHHRQSRCDARGIPIDYVRFYFMDEIAAQ
jgi:hypothetical protein